MPGDISGDGADDVVARRPERGLWLFPGDGRGRFLRATRIGVGWKGFSTLLGPGDVNGDLIVDLVARSADGSSGSMPVPAAAAFATASGSAPGGTR